MILKNRRYRWTLEEDRMLLYWKLGSMVIKQVKSHAFLTYGVKDAVKSVLGKVCKFIFLSCFIVTAIVIFYLNLKYLLNFPTI